MAVLQRADAFRAKQTVRCIHSDLLLINEIDPQTGKKSAVVLMNQGRTRACYPLPDRGYSGRRENPRAWIGWHKRGLAR